MDNAALFFVLAVIGLAFLPVSWIAWASYTVKDRKASSPETQKRVTIAKRAMKIAGATFVFGMVAGIYCVATHIETPQEARLSAQNSAAEARADADKKSAEDAAERNPNNLLQSIVPEEGAKPDAVMEGGILDATFSLDPWSGSPAISRTVFLTACQKLVPAAFKKYPGLNKVEVSALATMGDDRGHRSEEKVMACDFTRKNAADVVWENVEPDKIPGFADYFWDHPAFHK